MTAEMAAGGPNLVARPDRRSGTDRRSALRCNAADSTAGEPPPQRAPRAPDTEWGRPRAARGWSLRELSKRTGINVADLSRIERGLSCAKRDQARRLLAVFDEEPTRGGTP
jgi:hypothetical protein